MHDVIGQEKPHVHLAPEYEYRVKHLMNAYKISLKHVPWPQIHLGVCVD